MNKISIIIPTFNEEIFIFKVLSRLKVIGFGNSEIIVVDGSEDNLTEIEVKKIENIKYIKNINSSRANSMNLGAKNSTGEILLFLHGDSFLHENAFYELSNLELSLYNYGGFYKNFFPTSGLLKKLSDFNNHISLSVFHNLLGDNSIFISKKLFNNIGGYRNIKLMEDVEFSKVLKKEGNIKIFKSYVKTSSRKFMKRGVIITLIFMKYIRFLYFIGVNDKKLEELYRKF